MTLGRLLVAWLLVALWFVLASRARRILWAAGEALAVTLLGSLWFDSLGHGGWWLLFSLAGLLAAYHVLEQAMRQGAPPWRTAARGLFDVARYVVAGGILAWRLA